MQTIAPNILATLRKMQTSPGATDAEMAQLKQLIGEGAPEEYYDLMRYTNGAEGKVGDDGKYFLLYSIASNLEAGKCVEKEFAPGLFIFASNGGGFYFGLDLRECRDRSRTRYVTMDMDYPSWNDIYFETSSLSLLFDYLAQPY